MNVKAYVRKNLSTITMVAILVAFRWSFADQYRVPTGSMLPTIQIGDHLLTNKLAYDFRIPFTEIKVSRTHEPKRGDIIIFKFPKDENTNLVKRVIGLPGEVLKIENNKIYINGNELNEEYLPQESRNWTYEHHFEVIIPKDHFFVMGDNRMNSYDSRSWGLVPRLNIKGQAMSVLWNISFNKIFPSIDLRRIGFSFTKNSI